MRMLPFIDEHRRRIRHWIGFKGLEHHIQSSDGTGEPCAVCRQRVEPGQLAFVITFKSIMVITLDLRCMDLWCAEIAAGA